MPGLHPAMPANLRALHRQNQQQWQQLTCLQPRQLCPSGPALKPAAEALTAVDQQAIQFVAQQFFPPQTTPELEPSLRLTSLHFLLHTHCFAMLALSREHWRPSSLLPR